jgi:hypothetical protein
MLATPLPTPKAVSESGFAGGTRIHTNQGLKPIEDIRVGDWVLTHTEQRHPPPRRRQPDEYQYRRVTRVTSADVQSLVHITLQNFADGIQDILLVAPGQPIWTQSSGWLAASEVGTGQALVLSFNGNAMVREVQASTQPARAYRLEVEEGRGCYVELLGAWVGCTPIAATPALPDAGAAPPFDFGKSAVLLEIKDYYNDTLAETDWHVVMPSTSDLAAQMLAAAEELRGKIKAQLQLELDYDEAGVRWLDGYIDRARLRPTDDRWKGAIQVIGAFLGECTIRSLGGHWAMYGSMPGIAQEKKGFVFPHNKVVKQFRYGKEGGDSILGFYEMNKVMDEVMAHKALTPAQERLQEFSRHAGNRIFVPNISGETSRWVQVAEVKDRELVFLAPPTQRYTVAGRITDVRCFYVCDSGGQLVHTEWINKSDWDSLPPDILAQLKRKLAADTSLTLDQLERGRQFVEVSYGASDQQADGRSYCYSTSLKNISSHRIRITRFGGYRPGDAAWQLSNVTGDFYTADQFKDWYGQKAEFLLPGETVCDASNWGNPPVLWAYHGITDAGESFVAGKVLEKPFAGSGAHFVKPMQPRPDMAHIIAKLRASYEQRQQHMSAISLASLVGPKPSWLKPTDGLTEFFEWQTLLLTEGHVAWGALVQANQLLFKPGEDNCPALLVHSLDSYFDARPQELQLIGSTFFSLKNIDFDDPELKEVARLVTDEMDRSMGFELPKVFSDKMVQSATFMGFRKHIPNGVLSSGLFPILTHPSTRAVMMVPFEAWPIELIVLWKERNI